MRLRSSCAVPNRNLLLTKIRPRVLIADIDTSFARRLGEFLWERGFECRVTTTISEAKEIIEFWHPESVFVDLMLPETNALSLIKFIRTKAVRQKPTLIVMSKYPQPQGLETMRRAGASHCLIKPFALEEAARLLTVPELPEIVGTDEATLLELHLLNLFLQQALAQDGGQDRLFNLLRMINIKVRALRCSVIQCVNEKSGMVVASNDDPEVNGLSIDLEYYPEVLEVRCTQKSLMISSIRSSELMAPVLPRLAQTPFQTLALFPVLCRGEFYGVLSLRMEQKERSQIPYIEKFGQVCAQILSLAISA